MNDDFIPKADDFAGELLQDIEKRLPELFNLDIEFDSIIKSYAVENEMDETTATHEFYAMVIKRLIRKLEKEKSNEKKT